jgi:RNA polymerase sigma-70 factor (ECF subfamily)
MARYAAGDDRAFRDVYHLVAPKLRAFLVRRMRDKVGAEDLLQHTFLRIHAARGRFCQGAEVMPWAFAIARRLLIDAYRGRGRERLVVVEDELLDGRPAKGNGLEELVDHRRLVHRVQQELVGMPKTYRVAFELVLLDGMTTAEAARTLGTTVNAVKIRIHRAYVALRHGLRD